MDSNRKAIVRTVSINLLLEGLYSVIFGSLLPHIRTEYSFDYTFIGILISVNYAGMMVMSLLSGFLTLKIGRKRSLFALIVVGIIAFFLMLFAQSPAVLVISSFMIGLCRGGSSTCGSEITNSLGVKDNRLMNFVHSFFAVGACIAPLIFLAFDSTSGWRGAVILMALIGFAPLISGFKMKIKDPEPVRRTAANMWGFFKENLFWISLIIQFCYVGIEGSVVGWLVTYFTDINISTESSAQILSTIVWVGLLAGRFMCTALAKRMRTSHMLLMLSAISLVSYVLMIGTMNLTAAFVLVFVMGVGFSGIFACSVANAGDIFDRYPVSLGIFAGAGALGAVIAPAIMGVVADGSGISAAMLVLVVFLIIQACVTVVNIFVKKRMARKA